MCWLFIVFRVLFRIDIVFCELVMVEMFIFVIVILWLVLKLILLFSLLLMVILLLIFCDEVNSCSLLFLLIDVLMFLVWLLM